LFVGDRDADSANYFMHDVASRLVNSVQLPTDGHYAYLNAVDNAFHLDIDYAMLVKLYGAPEGKTETERKYSSNECTGGRQHIILGTPTKKFISTSYVERSNLSIRMCNRRFTRLTNAFNKKFENHCHSLALYFVYYNFCKSTQKLFCNTCNASRLNEKTNDLRRYCIVMRLRCSKEKREL